MDNIPPKPANSTRIVLELNKPERRLDSILLAEIRTLDNNLNLREITRVTYKELFNSGKILIKGQRARPSSGIAKGTTYVDILGY